MFEKVWLFFKLKDLRKKIIFVMAILAVFRVASSLPVPGIDLERLRAFFSSNQFFGLMNIFTGGALSNLSVIMLGLGPYITSSIILQLLTMIFPSLKEMYQEAGEAGRQKFNQYSRLLAVPLAILQSYSMIVLFTRQGLISPLSVFSLINTICVITAGSLFLMWLGELITEKGLGNGVSILIFAGIVAGFPVSIGETLLTWDSSKIFSYVGFLVMALLVIGGVVVITEAQRNIPVSYARRIRGHRMYGGVSSHLPLRVNQAGVIPIIFALSIMLFPGMIANFVAASPIGWLSNGARFIADIFQNQLFYGILYFILVVLFTYFYTAVSFDPEAISSNIQKQGGFIPGIRPGKPTAEFLGTVLNRITLLGAIFLGAIAVLPLLIKSATGLATMSIGGTALLIVVSVVIETMRQVESQLVMRDYEGF